MPVTTAAYSGALEAIDRILNRGGDADDVLRDVVRVLHERLGRHAQVLFAEGDALVAGPEAGTAETTTPYTSLPVVFQGARVAELTVGLEPDAAGRAFLARVATLISPYCLVGWDTGGEAWEP
jgi:hypothetical protein